MRAAAVACAVINSAPFRKRGAAAVTPEDVFGTLRAERAAEPPQAPRQMAAVALAITRAMGGKVVTIPRGGGDGRQADR